MDLSAMKLMVDILGRQATYDLRDWGDEENRKKPIEWQIDPIVSEGDGMVCVQLPRRYIEPTFTVEERAQLEAVGWFFDDELEMWCHH